MRVSGSWSRRSIRFTRSVHSCRKGLFGKGRSLLLERRQMDGSSRTITRGSRCLEVSASCAQFGEAVDCGSAFEVMADAAKSREIVRVEHDPGCLHVLSNRLQVIGDQ